MRALDERLRDFQYHFIRLGNEYQDTAPTDLHIPPQPCAVEPLSYIHPHNEDVGTFSGNEYSKRPKLNTAISSVIHMAFYQRLN